MSGGPHEITVIQGAMLNSRWRKVKGCDLSRKVKIQGEHTNVSMTLGSRVICMGQESTIYKGKQNKEREAAKIYRTAIASQMMP